MKTIKNLLLCSVVGLSFVACKNSEATQENEGATEAQATKAEIAPENLQTASFTIEGMHCEFGCAKGIEKKLAKLEGIQSASVDFEKKHAVIEYDATVHTPQILADLVESMDSKYKVSDITSSSDSSFLYLDQEQPKSKKEKKSKKSKKEEKEAEASTTTPAPAEKKGCCSSGKSSCSSKEKSGTM